MAKYVILSEETKAIKKSIKKFSERDIASFNDRLRGSFKIVGFRRYQFHDEVDIEFNGELFAARHSLSGRQWLGSDVYNQNGISKIKVNKLIKREIFKEVKDQAAYFGINLRYVEEIKKIKWV